MNRTKKPTEHNRYLARDGFYYNGYFTSNDHVEDSKREWIKAGKAVLKITKYFLSKKRKIKLKSNK